MKKKIQLFTSHPLFAYVLVGNAMLGWFPQWTLVGHIYKPMDPVLTPVPQHRHHNQKPQLFTGARKPNYPKRSTHRQHNQSHVYRNVTPAKQHRLTTRVR